VRGVLGGMFEVEHSDLLQRGGGTGAY